MSYSYGSPGFRRPFLHQRGDYILLESRRTIPGDAVRRPPRGSAVAAALQLVMRDIDPPGWLCDLAAEELVTGEVTALPFEVVMP